jgi:geranylgeranyl pyrophosphate synthase
MIYTMQSYFEQKKPLIERAVREFFPTEINQKLAENNFGNYSYEFQRSAWKPAFSSIFYEFFERGGKRIRPVLTCLTYDAFGGKMEGNASEIYRFAIISELIHSGTLMIDDIEDNSELRRGKPTSHKIFGTGLTVNNGNFLYFYPQLIIKQSSLSDAIKVKLYELLIQTLTNLHIGQGMDIYWGKEKRYETTVQEYLQMCAYKTGALLAIAMKTGAILVGASDDKVEKLGAVAEAMGIAFQIRDDILNLKPTSEWGKEKGEDITEGKITYMVADTMERAKEADRQRLRTILSLKTKDEKLIGEAITILDKYDAFEKAKRFADELISQAKHLTEDTLPESQYKKMFLEVLDFMVGRGK